MEVDVVLNALPCGMCRIGLCLREAIDTKEHIAGVDEVLHERKANLIAMQSYIIKITVTLGYLLRRDIIGSPAFGDGWHHSCSITLVTVSRVIIFWTPNKNTWMVVYLSAPIKVEVVDAKEFKIILRFVEMCTSFKINSSVNIILKY